ncbi:hypothetical protein [Pannonibacter indicus]|uniref:Uncharacterized protein n=1 Tax=Pannonibacter indicus TaxID=466044 RepID=A0A0K6HQC3_9HYPH|nr:hypothetical protein [Pannonibacter indicus]CUA93051.1 hypothetical protein Ga0061067_102236 [Pannonibacter indicus]
MTDTPGQDDGQHLFGQLRRLQAEAEAAAAALKAGDSHARLSALVLQDELKRLLKQLTAGRDAAVSELSRLTQASSSASAYMRCGAVLARSR